MGGTWFASRLFFSRGDAGNLSSRRAFVPGAPCPNLGNARLFCALSHGRLPSHSSLLSCAGSAGATACAPCSETIHWDWTRPVSNIGPWKSKEFISPLGCIFATIGLNVLATMRRLKHALQSDQEK